jgi:hypothetical protein
VNIVTTRGHQAHIAKIDASVRAQIETQIKWMASLDSETFTAKAHPKHERRHRIAVLDFTSPVGAMHYLRCTDTVRVLFGRSGEDLTLVGLITRAA